MNHSAVESVEAETDGPHLRALDAGDALGVLPEQRYELASRAFPDWLAAEPVKIPMHHPILLWHCWVPECSNISQVTRLCTSHARDKADSGQSFDEFVATAHPTKTAGQKWEWALHRNPNCLGCMAREAQYTDGYCISCRRSRERAARRDVAFNEEAWRSSRTPVPLPDCLIHGCVHDAVSSSPAGDRTLCRSHWQRWNIATAASPAIDWEAWQVSERTARPMRSWTSEQLLRLDVLPEQLQRQIRYALWRLDGSDHAARTPVFMLRSWIDWLQETRVQSLTEVAKESPRSAKQDINLHRRLVDLARPVSVTAEQSMQEGWFDPVMVGATLFKTRGKHLRRNPISLNSIPQHWARNITWRFLKDEALKPAHKRRTSHNLISCTVRGMSILGVWLAENTPDAGEHPELLNSTTARSFTTYLDTCLAEGILLPGTEGKAGRKPPSIDTISNVSRGARLALELSTFTFGPGFLQHFPRYPLPQRQPTPRPLDDDTWRALSDPHNLQLLDEKDPHDVGYVDIWLTHMNQASRIGEVTGLALGCLGRVGNQPYLWRDQTKIGQVDHGTPCHPVVYQRLNVRQEKTRRRLRVRYSAELSGLTPRQQQRWEEEWDKTKPLFPRLMQNPNLSLSVDNSFREGFGQWVESINLPPSVTSHRTRHTMATKLLNSGAPGELVSELLGHVSRQMLRSYAQYSDLNRAQILNRVWTAGPGMSTPGQILATPGDFAAEDAHAAQRRIDLTVIPVEHGACIYGPVVGGADCPWGQQCTSDPSRGPCDNFVLTGADLTYWERRIQAEITFAERAPTDETRDYIMQALEGWRDALDGLRACLTELGLVEDAERLDLRNPAQDYLNSPLWSAGWRWGTLTGQVNREASEPVA